MRHRLAALAVVLLVALPSWVGVTAVEKPRVEDLR